MASSTYPASASSEAESGNSAPPAWLKVDGVGEEGKDVVVVMTLEQLLPMSFGPEQLAMERV